MHGRAGERGERGEQEAAARPGAGGGAVVRTLHIATERGWRGGEQQVLQLLLGLRRAGMPAWLVCRRGEPLAARAAAAGLEVVALRVAGEFDLLAAWRVAQLVRRHRIELIHAHTAHALTLGAVARWLQPRRRVRLVAARRVDYSIYRHSFLGLNALKYRAADRLVAVSEAVARVLRADGIEPWRIAVVRSGIELGRLVRVPHREAELRARLGIAPDEPLLGTVGALVGHKGHRHLLAAMPAVLAGEPRARLLVVGEGPLRGALAEQARALGIEGAVVFAGELPAELVPSALRLMRVFVFPSVEEGLGTSVLDAMEVGVPVVASRAGGIPELIEHERSGLLVPPGDPQALARAVLRLLREPEFAAALARAAQAHVRAHGSAERMVAETIALYRQLVCSRRAGGQSASAEGV